MNSENERDQYFRRLEEHDRFSGVVLVTRGDSHLYSEAYGYASRSWRIRNTLGTRFDTASITKLFTSIATLQLIDQGLLELKTGVTELLGLSDTAISAEVNIYHLLTHSSGIGDDADEEAGERYEDLWRNKPNYAVTTTADFLPQFVYKPPNFAPGQGSRYCNCGYILLGLAVEKITGMPYREYVKKNVFDRAGMDHSGFFSMDRVHDNVAEGSDPIRNDSGEVVDWKKNIYSYPPIGSPDGGAHVTAGDLDRFIRVVKAGGLLSPKMTDAFLTPQVVDRRMDGWTKMYGYGPWHHVDDSSKTVFYEKEGINAGVSGLTRRYLDRDISVVILSNMESGAWDPIRKIHGLITSDAIG
ncbi:MAG: penicillin-binding protein [Chloroflexi bacterium]|nr:penicillin-binding protein [Chloroflexota bacterium]